MTRPPSGFPPPATAIVEGGTVDLEAMASTICDRYYAEYTDEDDRYGDAGAEWCRHDNQWLLSWAVGDVLGTTVLSEQVQWLAGILQARGFPLDRLARDLELAADVAEAGQFGRMGPEVAARLRDASRGVTAAP